MSRHQATITWDVQLEVYKVSFPYSPAMVLLMKQIPSAYREWNPGEKVWYIREEKFDAIKQALEVVFGQNSVIIQDKAFFKGFEAKQKVYEEAHVNVGKNIPSAEEDLQSFASLTNSPVERVKIFKFSEAKSVYREFAFLYHPDKNHGHNGDKMYQLNEVWDRLSKTYYKEKQNA